MNARLWLSLAVLSSCGPLEVAAPELVGTGSKVLTGAEPDAGTTPVADGGTAPTGLPCDVRTVLQTHCASCHTGRTYAPEVMSRAQLMAKVWDGELTVGAYAVQRMSPGATSPMPPYGSKTTPSAEEVAAVAGWVEAGMPGGLCGDLTP